MAHIEVGQETRLGGQLRQHIDAVQRVVEESVRLKAVMDAAGADSNWTGLRAAFGFASDSEAQTVYNLMTDASTTLSGKASITQLLSILG